MTGARALATRVSLSLSFEPRAEQIASLRDLISDLCAPHVESADALSRLLLAAHELLENIVKYAASGSAQFSFELVPVSGGLNAVLRTSNRATPERLEDARRRLDELARARDPVAFYDEMIRTSARLGGSGLGLARILAESELRLGYEIARDVLTISAELIVSRQA